jgi:multiple sugar transport system permease protein
MTSLAPSHEKQKRRGISLMQRDSLWGYLFIAPQMIGFFLFVLGPLVAILVFSTQDRNLLSGNISFIGLQNFNYMLFQDPVFYKMLGNSLTFTAGLVPMNVALALMLAITLAPQFRGVNVFRAVFFAPVITSTVAWVIVWSFMLQGKSGFINQLLGVIGVQGPNWLFEGDSAMFAVIFVRVLKNVGLNMVIFLAAIQDLPRDHVEAAHVDGANRWQTIRHIILPFLAPSILLATIITIIGSLNVFDHILLMTGGGPSNATMVLAYYVYFNAFKNYDIGYGSAISVLIFSIALTLTVIQWSVRRRFVYNER